jgi:hypothetical protein
MAIKTFDPANYSLIIGPHIVEGFADGEFMNLSFQDDDWEHVSGADGEEMRVKKNDLRAELTMTLLQSSASNDYLSTLRSTDQASGAGVVPMLLKDNNGNSVAESIGCWVKRAPDMANSKSPSNREWVLQVYRCNVFIGGNN